MQQAIILLVLENNVVAAALDNADGGYKGELRVALERVKIRHAAAAHCGRYLVYALFEVVVQGACVGDVGVDALLEAELALTSEVIALPVAGAVRALDRKSVV